MCPLVSALAVLPNLVSAMLPSVSAMCPLLVFSLSARCLLFIRSLSAFVWVYGLALAEPLCQLYVRCLVFAPLSFVCLVWSPLAGSALVCPRASPRICTLTFVFPLCPGFLYLCSLSGFCFTSSCVRILILSSATRCLCVVLGRA